MELLPGLQLRVTQLLSLVLAVVVLASALVLLAQTEAGMATRRQELAIMRTLGAPGRLLRRAVSWEFLILGGIAGLLAVMVAELLFVCLWNTLGSTGVVASKSVPQQQGLCRKLEQEYVLSYTMITLTSNSGENVKASQKKQSETYGKRHRR